MKKISAGCIIILVLFVPQLPAGVRRNDIQYNDHGKRDPFRPLIGKDVAVTKVALLKSVEDLTIEGILFDAVKGSVVVVNGQVLKEGNSIGGFRIDAIAPAVVTFSRDGKLFKVRYGQTGEDTGDDRSSMFTDVPDDEMSQDESE